MTVRRRGHTASTLELTAVDVRRRVANFDVDRDVGLVDVDAEVGIVLEYYAADVGADLRRVHRETLVAALCLALEGAVTGEVVLSVDCGDFADLRDVLLDDCGAADSGDAENLARFVERRVEVEAFAGGEDDGALHARNGARAVLLHAAANLGEHQTLERAFVQPFERDFAVFEEDYFFHGCCHFLVLYWGYYTIKL